MTASGQRNIVIIGGGIIGCTTAYYLSRHPKYSTENTSITVLEASSIAGGASGKAGGLVAKWAYPKELVKVTFAEHERLAAEQNGRGEELEGGSKKMDPDRSLQKKEGLIDGDSEAPLSGSTKGLPRDLDWVKSDLTDSYAPMARHGETAQVHPYLFTNSMIELAQEKGVKVVYGKATSIGYASDGAVESVTYIQDSESHTIPTTDVIVSAGPWTSTVLPQVPISGTRAHSITIRPSRPVSAYALFTEIQLPDSAQAVTPEIYARPNNEVYACSPGDGKPMPESTKLVEVDEKVCEALFAQVASISDELRKGEVTAKQACYLPNVNSGPQGHPIIGSVRGSKGLVIAAGHTCWGICNAPGTAKAVSELVMDGKITCGKLDKLAPHHFF
ncbi:FAD dependent oxidoreductase [Sistotremastrum suecicum HHB10207 ss-3]|uniref:FAD dependent oxidoreductase n=1 Tax=Sistotremastrum suecicum HHB10207 ss-3 TaxID=1314776 RepID=A0A166I4S7_9AGAM|nr:FAD dependent oxidoreductase [Sistotremastrum suecicum HHB10207 ss-3]